MRLKLRVEGVSALELLDIVVAIDRHVSEWVDADNHVPDVRLHADVIQCG